MSTSLTIPPPLVKSDPYGQQHAAELQQFYQRNSLPEVLRFDIANLAAIGVPTIARVPIRPGIITKVRTYAYAAGSGSYTIDAYWYPTGGVTVSVFAAIADRIVSNVGSNAPVMVNATAGLRIDPSTSGILYVWVCGFAGTAWQGVTIELILEPFSY